MNDSECTEKNSETIELRLPYSTKAALMQRVQERGETASEVLRRAISAYLAEDDAPDRSRTGRRFSAHWRMSATGLVLLLVASGALIWNATRPESIFRILDDDRNGRLTRGEISAEGDSEIIAMLDRDGSGYVTPEEFRNPALGSVVSQHSSKEIDKKPQRTLTVTRVFFFTPDGRFKHVSIATGSRPIPYDMNDDAVQRVVAEMEDVLDTKLDTSVN